MWRQGEKTVLQRSKAALEVQLGSCGKEVVGLEVKLSELLENHKTSERRLAEFEYNLRTTEEGKRQREEEIRVAEAQLVAVREEVLTLRAKLTSQEETMNLEGQVRAKAGEMDAPTEPTLVKANAASTDEQLRLARQEVSDLEEQLLAVRNDAAKLVERSELQQERIRELEEAMHKVISRSNPPISSLFVAPAEAWDNRAVPGLTSPITKTMVGVLDIRSR